MNVSKYIREIKEKALDRGMEHEKKKIMVEQEHLQRERARQAQLAQVNAKTAQLRQDTQKIQQFNQKAAGPKQESALMRFGKNLAAIANKETHAVHKSKVNPSKAIHGGIRLGSLNAGSSGIDFGGNSGGSPFRGSNKPKKSIWS